MSVRRWLVLAVGALLALLGLAATGAGAVIAVTYQVHHDRDGYVTTAAEELRSDTRAITSGDIELDLDPDRGMFVPGELGRLRVRVEAAAGRPIFVGIAVTYAILEDGAPDLFARLGGGLHATGKVVRMTPPRPAGSCTTKPPTAAQRLEESECSRNPVRRAGQRGFGAPGTRGAACDPGSEVGRRREQKDRVGTAALKRPAPGERVARAPCLRRTSSRVAGAWPGTL